MTSAPGTAVVELTFEVRDDDCLFVAASDAADCTIVGERAIQRSDGTLLEFFSVSGVPVEDALRAIRDHESVDEARVVHAAGEEALVEVHLDGPCVSRTLVDAGAILRSAAATDGLGTVVADVPAPVDAGSVADRFVASHPASTLTAKRDRPGRIPGLPDSDRTAILSRLTDKQRRAIETALFKGYFAWPRGSSAEECATALGISQPTFSQHLRRGQEKLLRALLAEAADPYEHRQDA